MRLVREALGADAVVLSNRTNDDGSVEIVALADTDLAAIAPAGGDAPTYPTRPASSVPALPSVPSAPSGVANEILSFSPASIPAWIFPATTPGR